MKINIKKIITFIFLSIIILPFHVFAASEEKIESFTSDIYLYENADVIVGEKILYDFGTNRRHGIFRYVPYKYHDEKNNIRYANIADISVTDEKGNKIRYLESYDKGSKIIRIGDEDTYVSGQKYYYIYYKIVGVLNYFEKEDEFFWDVNGFGWNVPIKNSTATVHYPVGMDPANVQAACFAGLEGSKNKCEKIESFRGGMSFGQNKLLAGQNLSVVLDFPKGTFANVVITKSPSFNDKYDAAFNKLFKPIIPESLKDLFIFLAVIMPFITLIYMFFRWVFFGRDKGKRGALVVQYDPPDGLNPIQCGVLYDWKMQGKDISAEIIYLATQGFLAINRIPGKFRRDDFELTLLKDYKNAGLPNFDRTLLSGIFDGDKKVVKISDLSGRGTVASKLKTVRKQVFTDLYSRGTTDVDLEKNYDKMSNRIIGITMLGILGALLLSKIGLAYFAPAILISGVVVYLFEIIMPRRTELGVEVRQHILGLKRYIKVAEKDRIKFHNEPQKDPKKFEELLPYAMIFGLEKNWAKQFDGVVKMPDWYTDTNSPGFVDAYFSNTLGSFVNVSGSAFSSAGFSSSAGGISGGGGGSGGGFGGGGGGSW